VRPIIGVTTYREIAKWGQWDARPSTLLPADYADAVTSGGGTPVLLPPYGIADDYAEIVSRLDGLVIAGGSDINPSRYGQEPEPMTVGWRDERDVSELALLTAAADLDLPTLGVCRGMQMMAVHAGGTLFQHVPDRVGSDTHSPGPGRYQDNQVHTVPGTIIAGILGPAPLAHCHHHQAVDQAPGFVSAAYTEDGLVEAMEDPNRRFALGVQWHPETGTDLRIFTALAEAARQYRRAQQSTSAAARGDGESRGESHSASLTGVPVSSSA
jgi:putative glutamine amidotransferase